MSRPISIRHSPLKLAIMRLIEAEEIQLTTAEISEKLNLCRQTIWGALRELEDNVDVKGEPEPLVEDSPSYWDGKMRWSLTVAGRVRLRVVSGVGLDIPVSR